MAVIIALSFLYLAIPKYKVIKETEHCSDYGNTLTIYVMPLFFISESGADSYGRHLAKKHSAGKKLDAVEVIFVSKTTNLYEETNEYFTNIYYVPSLSN
jgi:pantothenate synthetase